MLSHFHPDDGALVEHGIHEAVIEACLDKVYTPSCIMIIVVCLIIVIINFVVI